MSAIERYEVAPMVKWRESKSGIFVLYDDHLAALSEAREEGRTEERDKLLAEYAADPETTVVAVAVFNRTFNRAESAERERDEVRGQVAALRAEVSRLRKALCTAEDGRAPDEAYVSIIRERNRLHEALEEVTPFVACREECRSHEDGPDTCECGADEALTKAKEVLGNG